MAENPQIIDTTYFSLGFPNEKVLKGMPRRNYFSDIKQILSDKSNTEVLFLSGQEDSGKTTLCAQYAKKNENVVTVFFNPLSTTDYLVDNLYINFYSQSKFICHKNEFNSISDDVINKNEYSRSVLELKKFLKSRKKTAIIIIDGLENIVSKNEKFIFDLFDDLPFGNESIKFLITGNKSDFSKISSKIKKLNCEEITLNGFSEPEIKEYLGLDLKKDYNLEEIYTVTRGLPGRLDTIKRLLKEHQDIDLVLTSLDYIKIVERDCNKADLKDKNQNAILSTLSLIDKKFNLNILSQVIKIEELEILEIVHKIEILETTNSEIKFVSAKHREYFSNMLRANKDQVYSMLVEYYAKSNSSDKLIELPSIYKHQESWDKIISLLDRDFLPNVLESTGSMELVNKCLDYGVEASKKAGRYGELWRYSIQGSIVNELDNYLFWESEIEAMISLKDYQGAIELANSAILKVDRLSLLALIAKKQKEFEDVINDDLSDIIKELYAEVDFASVGEKIYDIVSNLIYSLPNLAIEVIEKSSLENDDKNNINDWILAKLSISAIDSAINNEEVKTEKKLQAIEKINSPNVKKINRAIGFLVGNYNAEKVLDEVRKLSDSSERLRLIRLWLINNTSVDNKLEKVIERGIEELILSGNESNINALKELSSQLAYINDADQRKILYSKFKSIEKVFSDLGPIKNRYKYELNMFHTKYTFDKKAAQLILQRILKNTETIEDKLIKFEIYAEIYSTLCTIIGKQFVSQINYVYKQILNLTEEIYTKTSYHAKISKSVISIVGKKNPKLSLKIIEKINTKSQREEAKLELLEAYLSNDLNDIKRSFLDEIVSKSLQEVSKEDYLEIILERYSNASESSYETITGLIKYFEEIKLLHNPKSQVYLYVLALKIINKNNDWNDKISIAFQNKLETAWNKIDSEWSRIDSGYKICSELHDKYEMFAKSIYQKAEKIKNESWLDSRNVAFTYMNSIKIVLRAYNGLLISGNSQKEDIQTIKDLIARVPSRADRINLWTECCFGIFSYGDLKDFGKIVSENLIGVFEDLLNEKQLTKRAQNAYIIIRLYNSKIADNYDQKMDLEIAEMMFTRYCDFILTKESPYDAFEKSKNRYSIDYSDVVNALDCLKKINTDENIYYVIRQLCAAIKNNSKKSLSDIQITDIANKLDEVIEMKLPDKNGIKHDGYKILCQLKTTSIRKKGTPENCWSDLITSAKKIPNNSDKLLVLSLLLEGIPEKIRTNEIKTDLFESVLLELSELKKNNINYEFIQRVIELTDTMYKFGSTQWKEILNEAFNFSDKLEDGSEAFNAQKEMIDSMYRLNPDFAKQLINNLESDGNSKRINDLIKERYKTLEITKKIKENLGLEDKERENRKVLISGIYEAVKALNSNLISPRKISDISEYLALTSKLPLQEIFPVYMYYLTNCQVGYGSKSITGSVKDLHRINFKEAVDATALIEILCFRKKLSTQKFKSNTSRLESLTNRNMHPGHRDEAIQYIKKWLEENGEDFLIIVDPYFSKEDLDLLKIVNSIQSEIDVHILGSKGGLNLNIQSEYQEYWNLISQEPNPFTEITLCWVPNNNNLTPFHDRYLFTKNSALRLGTSLGSMGLSKESEISIMNSEESNLVLNGTINEYIGRKKRETQNMKIQYKSFTL